MGKVSRKEGVVVGEEVGRDEACVAPESMSSMISSVEPAPAIAERLAVGKALGIPLGSSLGKDIGSVLSKGLGALVAKKVGTAVGGADTLKKIVPLVVGNAMLSDSGGKESVDIVDFSLSMFFVPLGLYMGHI